jgi:hypothetical protein
MYSPPRAKRIPHPTVAKNHKNTIFSPSIIIFSMKKKWYREKQQYWKFGISQIAGALGYDRKSVRKYFTAQPATQIKSLKHSGAADMLEDRILHPSNLRQRVG